MDRGDYKRCSVVSFDFEVFAVSVRNAVYGRVLILCPVLHAGRSVNAVLPFFVDSLRISR